MRWSDRNDLWDEWQKRYTDWHKSDEDRVQLADAFFELHREEMLFGTEVLWSEAESYYDPMKLRIDEGKLSFDSEKQEPWFQWFDEEVTDREIRTWTDQSVGTPCG